MAHPKRKISKQEEIKDALITKLRLLRSIQIQPLEKPIYTTVLIGTKASFTTKAKWLLTLWEKKPNFKKTLHKLSPPH